MMMNNLFSDDEDTTGGSKSQLTINEHYAKAFEYRKEREELERCKYFYFFNRKINVPITTFYLF